MKWPKITWAQPGGLPECPYFRRWIIDFGDWSLRMHKWYSDDDHRAPHDHPTWFYTFVLKGGYDDVEYEVDASGACTVKDIHKMRMGSCAYRPANHLHSVQKVKPGTITLLLFGPPLQRWGFQFGGKKIMRDKYFAVQGHHPCDLAGEPVRLKPDGTRILSSSD